MNEHASSPDKHGNCGEPQRNDCSDILGDVWAFLDNECDGARRELVRQHLDECSPCLDQYGLEEHLKVLLARKCGGEHVSAEFRDRIRACIRKIVLEQTRAGSEADSTSEA
ncbi:MAG: mycothiol system anti-sigma-R factor [Kutzneria sp.]|nr:mycothiol system anti-sigma-R factor [Kutzneria sp.]